MHRKIMFASLATASVMRLSACNQNMINDIDRMYRASNTPARNNNKKDATTR
jgi:hypothetical protein